MRTGFETPGFSLTESPYDERKSILNRVITQRKTKTPAGMHRRALWYAWQDSNLRPLGPQPNALSPELQARHRKFTTWIGIAANRGRGGKGGIRTLGTD